LHGEHPNKKPVRSGLLLEQNFDQFQRTIPPENGNQREEIKDVLDALHAPVASHEAIENPLISLGTNGFMNLDTLLVIGNGGLRVVVAGHWVGP
jgi:hypothetical protein